MEGTERAQPVHFCLDRIVNQSCSVIWTWKVLSEHSLLTSSLNTIVYQSCRVIWTWKGLSEPSLFTLILTGLFTSLKE